MEVGRVAIGAEDSLAMVSLSADGESSSAECIELTAVIVSAGWIGKRYLLIIPAQRSDAFVE
jgi:hypothetical protein